MRDNYLDLMGKWFLLTDNTKRGNTDVVWLWKDRRSVNKMFDGQLTYRNWHPYMYIIRMRIQILAVDNNAKLKQFVIWVD